MRRTPFVVALAVVAALFVAACGGTSGGGAGDDEAGDAGAGDAGALPECPVTALDDVPESDLPIEVTLWHASVAKGEEAINEIADAYNASQDRVRIEVENQATSFEELQRKYNQAIPSNDLPGIALLEDTQTQAMADSGTILPAQSCIAADDYDMSDFVPTLVDYYSVDGNLYPASMTGSNALIYFNVDHFEEAGLDPENPPTNLDEIREAAQAIKDAGVTEHPFVWHMAPWQVEFWLTGNHIPFVDNNNGREAPATESVLNSEGALELFQWLKDMNDDGLMLPITDVPGQIDQYLALANEQGSFSVEASSAATSVEAFLKGQLSAGDLTDGRVNADVDLSGLNIGADEFPGMEEPGHIQVGGGVYYMMSTTPPEVQAAAWDYMKWVNSVDMQVVSNLVGSNDPTLVSVADVPEVARTWADTLSGQWLAISFEQQQNGIDPEFPGPLVGPYTEMRTAVRQAVEDMLLNDAAPEDVLADAEAEITEAIERYQEENF
ncbi:MAG: extracellular solute-binding protein [Acidimicrobiales bacterium]|nr:extracellular solute-binding protein [Acidimicrobiales bacterium]